MPVRVLAGLVLVEEEERVKTGDEERGHAMAYKILDTCGCCGVCVPECPVQAISAGDEIYVINEAVCVDCRGYYDEAACVAVCPMDCIVKTT